MKKIFAISACMLVVFLFTAACTAAQTGEKQLEKNISKLLTIPEKGIAKVATSDLMVTDPAEYDKQMQQAVQDFCGLFVAAEVIEDGGGRFYQDVIILHCIAAGNGFSYTVEQVAVTKVSEGHFRYTATIKASDKQEAVTINGSVQLDDKGYINYMSIE